MSDFPKLSEVLKEKEAVLDDLELPVFLLRVKNVQLVRYNDDAKDMIINMEPDPEVIMTGKQRRIHFASGDKHWLKSQLKIWESGTVDAAQIATEETPLEIMCGDITAFLKFGNGRRYGLTVYRDIQPTGWLMQGGSASTMEDIREPWRIATREFCEEVLITNKDGIVFIPGFTDESEVLKTASLWGLKPRQIVKCKTQPMNMPNAHADRVIIYHENSPWYKRAVYRSTVAPTPIFIDADISVISAKFPVEIEVPVNSIDDLRIYDCEEHWKHNDLPMNRPVRLIEMETGKIAAVYTCGQEILGAGYISPITEQVATNV